LPNSWTVVATGGRIAAFDPDGLRRWTAVMQQQDRIATPIAVAADGTVYLRGARALHALGADGRWRWRSEVPSLPPALAAAQVPSYAPIPMSDSTVALIAEPLELTAFTSAGEVSWRRELPGEGHPLAAPRSAPNGQIVVRTSAGVIAVSPAGRVDWQAEPQP
jgi:outer membrane protein assembly factor BamB